MMTKNAILIASTGQNVGKTTVCLGLLSGLQKRFGNVGFMKPIGQQHVHVSNEYDVDKDVVLFKEFFSLNIEYQDLSPVIFPRGFTRKWLDGQVDAVKLQEKILQSFQKIASNNEYTIVEGTGHVGVGSILGMNNAKIASLLGIDMVIVASGGLGSSFDELALNLAMCSQFGVRVRGIILNKIFDDKRDMILNYFPKALSLLNIPILGCLPYNRFLSRPTMQDFESLFNTTLIAGEQFRCRHFSQNRLMAGSLESYVEEMVPNELIITPACREDIIRATLHKHLQYFAENNLDFGGGMILTGRNPPPPEIILQIKNAQIPILYAPLCSYDAMKKITSFIAKIRIEDVEKIERAIGIVETYVNFDPLCQEQPAKK